MLRCAEDGTRDTIGAYVVHRNAHEIRNTETSFQPAGGGESACADDDIGLGLGGVLEYLEACVHGYDIYLINTLSLQAGADGLYLGGAVVQRGSAKQIYRHTIAFTGRQGDLFHELAHRFACALVVGLKCAAVHRKGGNAGGKLHLGGKTVKVGAYGKGYGGADYGNEAGRLVLAFCDYSVQQAAVVAGDGLQLSQSGGHGAAVFKVAGFLKGDEHLVASCRVMNYGKPLSLNRAAAAPVVSEAMLGSMVLMSFIG